MNYPTEALTSRDTSEPRTLRLAERDLAVILDVTRFKFLTSKQLHRVHFPGSTHENATKRLTALAAGELLSRVFGYPTMKPNIQARPTAIYYLAPKNQRRLRDHLEENGLASRWPDFEAAFHTHGKNEEFSQHYLVHELGISEFFLALEAGLARHPVNLAFWERTSPFSRDIGEQLDEHGEHYHFNPDAFFALAHPEGFRFFFLEYDNNTARPEKYRKKLMGYQAYNRQGRFAALLRRYVEKYGLPIRHPDKAGFRVLTVTPDAARRNQLFLDGLALKSFKMLWYGSIEDFTAQPLGPLWLRGKDYAPLAATAENTAPTLRRELLHKQLEDMPRVSLLD